MPDKKYATNFIMSNGDVVYIRDEDIDNKVDKVTGKGLSTNDFTNADKSKLDGISAGAQVNSIDTVQKNGTPLTITNKTVNVTVPVNVSELNNDSNYATKAFVNNEKAKLSERRFILIGDSYGDGYSPDGSVTGWCDRVLGYLGKSLGTDSWANHAGGACFGRSDNLGFDALLNAISLTSAQKQSVTDIVVAGGYNDFTWSVDNINAGMTRFETIVNANFPNATVWVIPIGWCGSRVNRCALVARYDEAYSRTARAKNWKYKAVYQQLHYKPYFSSDMIHPNGLGQYLIANCIAGLLVGSDIETNTQEQAFSYNGSVVGFAMRCGDTVHVRLVSFAHSGNNTVQPNSGSDLNGTIVCPYIFGDEDSHYPVVIPTVVQTANDGFYTVPMSVTFRQQEDNSIKAYGQTNQVNRTGSDFMTSNITGLQFKPCSFSIPIQYA